MDPTEFICGLMKHNTNSLGFIPKPTVRDRFVKRGLYIIQRTSTGRAVGFILHGPVHPNGDLYVHQACIEVDRRLKHWGYLAVYELIDRARLHGARRILLRCAEDIDGVCFWHAVGFTPTHITKGGPRRRRWIIHFEMDLTPLRL